MSDKDKKDKIIQGLKLGITETYIARLKAFSFL